MPHKRRLYPRILTTLSLSLTLIFISTSNSLAQSPNLGFSPTSVNATIGQSFDVNLTIDTSGQEVAGVGAELLYDPSAIAIISVQPGNLFDDFPKASFDNSTGKADISGIVSSLDNTVTGAGVVAQITFQTKKAGVTTVNFDFTPGATNDSNIAVTYGNGDILTEVFPLTVNSTGSENPPQNNIPQNSLEIPPPTYEGAEKNMTFWDKLKALLGFSPDENSTDPNKPITGLVPDTNPSQSQADKGRKGVFSSATTVGKVIWISLGIILLLVVALIIKLIKSKISKNSAVVVDNPVDSPPSGPLPPIT